MKLFNHFLWIVAIGLITSCNDKKRNTDEIIPIKLKSVKVDTSGTFYSGLHPMSYLDSSLSNLKGMDKWPDSEVMYYNSIRESQIEKIKESDSLGMLKNSRTKLFVLTGFKDNMQYYVADLNGNEDFGDDKFIEFHTNFGDSTLTNSSIIDSFPSYNLKMASLINDKIINDQVFITPYPQQTYHTYDESKNSVIKKSPKSNIKVRRRDFFLGDFTLGNIAYQVAIQRAMFGDDILFKKKEEDFYKLGDSRREVYKFGDTVALEDKFFRIDRFDPSTASLVMEKVTVADNSFGFRKGQIIQDYKLETITGEVKTLKESFGDKKYILLDFWGTWCAPCKELTPDLIKLSKEYKNKINVVGVAHEKDPAPVLKYAQEQGIDWTNFITYGTPKSSKDKTKIINDLRVMAFPTFILLDSDLKIVFRGTGNNLKEIGDYIN